MSYDRTNEDYEARAASDAASGCYFPSGPTFNEILQLQQRLKERTEQSMRTARRDAERIQELEAEVRMLRKELAKW